MNNTNTRIAWVDVLKFLGIWAIYIGHFGNKAGRVYPFVFSYHVPLFFFAAGFFSSRSIKYTPSAFLKKKTLQLMIPYVFFSLMALIIFTIQNDWNILQAKSALMGFLYGIRDQIVAGSLWFIPCLYVITVGDYIIVKIFKSKYASLVASVIAFVITQTLLPNNPATDPSWFMGVDSALFYYIYYALGNTMFPILNGDATTMIQHTIEAVAAVGAVIVTIITFFLTPSWFFGKIITYLPIINTFKLSTALFSLIIALVIIYCNVFIAKVLSHISFLQELGKETLVFCGTEDTAKIAITKLLAMISLKVRLNSPFMTVAFSLFCLVISKFTLIEFFNNYFPRVVGKTNFKTANTPINLQ